MKSLINIILTVFLSLFTVCVGMAQSYFESDTSTVRNKNAIGFYLNAPLIFAFNARSEHLRNGIQYKRILRDNKRLRATVIYQFDDKEESEQFPYNTLDTVLRSQTTFDSYQYGEFRFGMEWSDFKESHNVFFGLDFIIGYDNTKGRTVETDHYSIASVLYSARKTTEDYQDQSLLLGGAVLIGYRVEIQKNWEFTANFSPEIVYKLPVSNTNYVPQTTHIVNPSLQFRFRLLDVVLLYRF